MTEAATATPLHQAEELDRIAYPIGEVPEITGINRTSLYRALKEKRLTARKNGRRTIIEAAELQRYIASLPVFGRDPHEQAAA